MLAWWRTKHRNFDFKITLTREQHEGFLHGRIDAVLQSVPETLPETTDDDAPDVTPAPVPPPAPTRPRVGLRVPSFARGKGDGARRFAHWPAVSVVALALLLVLQVLLADRASLATRDSAKGSGSSLRGSR